MYGVKGLSIYYQTDPNQLKIVECTKEFEAWVTNAVFTAENIPEKVFEFTFHY